VPHRSRLKFVMDLYLSCGVSRYLWTFATGHGGVAQCLSKPILGEESGGLVGEQAGYEAAW